MKLFFSDDKPKTFSERETEVLIYCLGNLTGPWLVTDGQQNVQQTRLTECQILGKEKTKQTHKGQQWKLRVTQSDP